jgi:hypothetical protein
MHQLVVVIAETIASDGSVIGAEDRHTAGIYDEDGTYGVWRQTVDVMDSQQSTIKTDASYSYV